MSEYRDLLRVLDGYCEITIENGVHIKGDPELLSRSRYEQAAEVIRELRKQNTDLKQRVSELEVLLSTSECELAQSCSEHRAAIEALNNSKGDV